MKKIKSFFVALFAITSTFSAFGGLSVHEIENLTSGFSSFNGEEYNQFSSYDGAGQASILDQSRIFTITIVNSGSVAINGKRVYLLPGLGYATGRASVSGVLYDSGSLVDIAGSAMATATASGAPKTLDFLYSYLDKNPTLINMMKISSGNTAAQCSTQLLYRELSPFQDLESKVIPISRNQNEYATRDKIATVNLLGYNIIACPQAQMELPLYMAANDTTTVEIYFAKTLNSAAILKQQVAAALPVIAQNIVANNNVETKPSLGLPDPAGFSTMKRLM